MKSNRSHQINLNHLVYTFQYSEKDILYLLVHSQEFRDLLESGKYIYIDGFICLRSPLILYRENDKLKLNTTYLRMHIDEYCIGYHVVNSYDFGTLSMSKDVSGNRLMLYSRPGKPINQADISKASLDEKTMKKISDFVNDSTDTSDTFSKFLRRQMDKSAITQTKLAELSNLTTKTIYRMLNPSKLDLFSSLRKIDLNHVVACAIALHLDPFQSAKFLELSGHTLRKDHPVDRAYYCLLNFFYEKSVDDCNNILDELHMKPLAINKDDLSYKGS